MEINKSNKHVDILKLHRSRKQHTKYNFLINSVEKKKREAKSKSLDCLRNLLMDETSTVLSKDRMQSPIYRFIAKKVSKYKLCYSELHVTAIVMFPPRAADFPLHGLAGAISILF